MSDDAPDPLANVRHLFGEAEKAAENVVPMKRPAAADAPGPEEGKGKKEKAPKEARAYIELGESCPVRPLGVNGSEYYFLDAIDQLVVKHADKLSQNGVDDLFKHSNAQRWADANFGRKGEGGVINGIDRDLLKRALIASCGDLSMTGVFDPSGRVRGDGGWKDELGRLVFHCGDVILVADKDGRLHERRPGIHDHLIYPKGSRQLRPASLEDAIAGPKGPGQELLTLLETWPWLGGKLDALLSLGWQTLAPVGGAMRWRPAIWTTGDAGSGKSTLLDAMFAVQGGRTGMLKAANATGAGIWQALQFRSLPVLLDEVEAGKNNAQKEQLLDLMKISASGDVLRRGGGDHKAVEFSAFSPFHFTSINTLPLEPEHVSRMALLQLGELPKGLPRPRIDATRLGKIGSALRRRVTMAWPQWEEHLAPWWEPIAKEFTARTADTFGFLLAMANIALYDDIAHPDVVEETIAPLLPRLRELQTISGRDHERMLSHLGTWQLEPWDRGRKHTVRALVYWASSRRRTDLVGGEAERHGEEIFQQKAAAALRQHGLAVIRSRREGQEGKEELAIAFRHSALSRIFNGTKWQDGVWRQSATRTPGAETRKVRIEAGAEGAVLVPIAAMLGEEDVA
jgi:hypothetical protein